jgi:hypothetical protein
MAFLNRRLLTVVLLAMQLSAQVGFAQALTTTPLTAPAPAPAGAMKELVPFASEEGLARLSRAHAKVNFPALANQFEAQSNGAFCGPTSAAVVLNTVRGRSPDLPRDRSRLRPEDFQFFPNGFDPSVPRYTQDNVIVKGQKTRAQVLGEPVIVNGKQISDFGYQTRQFDEMLRANGLTTRLVIVDESKSMDDVRNDLVDSLQNPGRYAIVTYRRDAVGQRGGGHISPLAAFDAESDSFLVMDVNPTSAGWVWIPAATLVKAMRTFDTVENRGYVVVETR